MKNITVGIDIGGTNTTIGFVSKEGEIIKKSSIKTSTDPNISKFIEEITNEINSQAVELGTIEILAIGIGAPNGNYYKGTIEHAPNLAWKGIVSLKEEFLKQTKIPIYVTNDANAAAIGEMLFGNAKGMKNFVVITLGTGLGSGFVVNGEVLYGHDGFAGELGHTIVQVDGRICGCGRKGCLETYVSAPGLTKTMINFLEKSPQKSELRTVNTSELNSEMVYKAALKGDYLALKAFDFTANILGKELADMVAITSPEAIFLFGGLAYSGNFIFEPTEKYLNQYLHNIYKNKIKLLPSGLAENNAAVLGAAALAWNETGMNI